MDDVQAQIPLLQSVVNFSWTSCKLNQYGIFDGCQQRRCIVLSVGEETKEDTRHRTYTVSPKTSRFLIVHILAKY